jgi:hypothetical protein
MSESADKFNDPFAPPKVPCVVCCIHCGSTYDSWRIVWRDMPGEAIEGAWCCPIPGCDGVGFRFDIHPVDPRWEAEYGGMPPLKADFVEDEDEECLEQSDVEDDCEDDDEWDEFEHEPKFGLPVDEFPADAFWIDPARLSPRRVGNTPQPPFNRMPFGHAKSPDVNFDDDDLPF